MDAREYLELDDKALLAQCDVHTYKASGPGGQHRNKTSSAVRLRHRPTDVTAHGDQTRSQHGNKRLALRTLRMNIACSLRRPVDPSAPLPPVIRDCLSTPRSGPNAGRAVLRIGRRDGRYWQVIACLLDVLDHFQGRMAEAAAHVGISTANLAKLLTADPHVLTAAQAIRKTHGLRALR